MNHFAFRSFIALLVVLILTVLTMRAQASEPAYVGIRLSHTCITHSGEDYLIPQALAAWGKYSSITDCGHGVDIVVEWGYANGHAAYADVAGDWCRIMIEPMYKNDLLILTHEVGHCLGLGHFGNGIMNPYGGTDPAIFSTDDILAISTLYPKQPRPITYPIVIPMVVRD